MKSKFMFLGLGVLLSISCYTYFSFPPYYTSAYMDKTLKNESYEKLSAIVEKNVNQVSYQLSVAGDLLIEGPGVTYTPNEEKEISKLMNENNIFLMVNEKDLVLFHLGEGEKSGINFRAALAKKKISFNKNEMDCENIIFENGSGMCLFDFDQHWGVLYRWVDLNNG